MNSYDGSCAGHPATCGKPRRAGTMTYVTYILYLFAPGVLLLAIVVLTTCQGPLGQYAGSWLTFGDDPEASQSLTQSLTQGADPPQGVALSVATVSKLRKGWRVTLPG
jgi:hypothetical protein